MTNAVRNGGLAAILDAIVGAESGSRLLTAIATLLGSESRVWLADAGSDAFYCPEGGGDLPLAATIRQPPTAAHLCAYRGEVVAMLVSTHPDAATVAAALGPALVCQQVNEGMRARLRTAVEKTRLLAEAGELLQEFDLETVLVKSLQSALSAVRAEVGALLLAEGEGEAALLATRVAWGLRPEHIAALQRADGEPLAKVALADGATQIYDRARLQRDLAPGALEGINLTSLLVVPLIVGRRGVGVVLLVNASAAFDVQDRELAEAACRLAAIAVDNARLVASSLAQERIAHEVELAQRVQRRIFPAAALVRNDIAIAGRSLPCTETGGDYYQYREVGGRLAVMIGDVAGHGLGAALYTTMAHAALMQALGMGMGVAETFASVNRGLEGSSLDDSFMTAFLLVLDPATRRFAWTNAGQEGILHIHADGHVTVLDSQGFPLGMLPDSTYDALEGVLAPGDCLALLTDGLAECWSPQHEQFGLARLQEVAVRNRHLAPDAVIDALLAEIAAWAAGQPYLDDVTLVIVRG